MKTLDEKLKSIRKIDVSEQDVYRQAHNIEQLMKKPKQSFIPVVVTAFMFAILCFLVFNPASKLEVPEQATAIEELNIKEWIFINNERPKRVFNLNSANYIGRNVVNSEEAIAAMHQFLIAFEDRVVPWDEAYKEDYSVYDIQVNYTDEQSIYYKYSNSDLYDMTNKVKYNLTDEQRGAFLDLLFEARSNSKWSTGVIFGSMFFLLAIIFTFDWIYRKKYANLDERGAQKKLPYWITFLCTITLMSPLPLMSFLYGTIHLGLICIMIVCYVFITSQLEIKLGVIRPNNIHYKFLLPLYITLLIIAFVIITVV